MVDVVGCCNRASQATPTTAEWRAEKELRRCNLQDHGCVLAPGRPVCLIARIGLMIHLYMIIGSHECFEAVWVAPRVLAVRGFPHQADDGFYDLGKCGVS